MFRIGSSFLFNLRRAFSVKVLQDEMVAVSSFESNPKISVLTLSRAKQKNALNRNLVDCLNNSLSDVASSNARVLVIKSAVPNVFCAGADLKERLKMSQQEVAEFTHELRQLMLRLSLVKVPVIAAIDGLALGGGLELALACDLRVSATTSRLGLVETKLGIIPGAGGTVRLPRLINPAVAKELIYTARVIDGVEAKDLGLVNRAVEQNNDGNAAFLHSISIAEEIALNGPVAVRMAKVALNRGVEVDINTAMAIEELCYAQIIPTKDRMEGLEAFSEKRPPKYMGE